MVIKRSPGGQACRWRAINFEIHLWSSGKNADRIFGDRSASSMSKWRPAWTLTPEMIHFRTKSVTLSMYYPGQKNRYSRDIHEIDLQCDHVISCDIYFDSATRARDAQCRGSRRCRTEPRYHTIALLINLMNISAVTIFLARVVDRSTHYSTCRSTQVKSASTDLWPQEMFTFSEMLALFRVGKQFRCLRLS